MTEKPELDEHDIEKGSVYVDVPITNTAITTTSIVTVTENPSNAVVFVTFIFNTHQKYSTGQGEAAGAIFHFSEDSSEPTPPLTLILLTATKKVIILRVEIN
ncbi:hypothetical protein D9C73_019513 [Collichthys lucidus]|uniref:Uncharacterized protein n=1 Tax=Collichthys lucidus TaxID=240159 RepID=A0A4U5VD39_COLLU|nr:hypothetical protein D9C73_019513 [Collichthys lucidus]